jgi:hypothetical protein
VTVYPNVFLNILPGDLILCSGETTRFRDQSAGVDIGTWFYREKGTTDRLDVRTGPFSTIDFTFTNNHHVKPDEKLVPENKIYICAVATDAMGIGAWTKPGRGQIPYTWQVLMNWVWMNPPVLQYFYEDKSPNDYFIGGLSGPGYMYPKAIPADKWPALTAVGRTLMSRLDLRVLEIMDYSEGNRHLGNTDLPKEVVDRYYEQYPDAIGFINGYGSARTFDLRDGRPLHQVPVLLWTPGGLDMTHNPAWFEATATGLRGYFMPEDDTSTIYVYDAELPKQ